jgi:hypothetical protein
MAHRQRREPGERSSSRAARTLAGETPRTTPALAYRRRLARYSAERDRAYAQRQRLRGRILLLVGAAIVCAIAAFAATLLLLIPTVALAAQAYRVATTQGEYDRAYLRLTALVAVQEEGLARLTRDWDALPLRQPPPPPAGQPAADVSLAYAADLDLQGRASLLHLLGTANTPGGQVTLRRWLLAPAPCAVVRDRQQAVAELAPDVDLRDELAVHGRRIAELQPTYLSFLAWAEGAPWLTPRPMLVWLSWLLPLLTIGCLCAEIAQITAYPLWAVFAAISWLLAAGFGRQVDGVIDQVSERQSAFRPYAELFALLSARRFEAPLLRGIQDELAAGDLRAAQQMRALARIMTLADLRLSILEPFLQIGLLWNFHVLRQLERWQHAAGHEVRAWMETLSEMESLAALATLAYDHPGWGRPEILAAPAGPHEPVLVATALGHPLLPPDACVGNDVSLGPPGTFLLVTGSNMSGKSTLLRAIGTNVVLAQAGAPVCASTFRLRPAALATSIRVQDSLEYGVSYFMAELARLKLVVDETDAVAQAGERTPLFLLDEILRGTNTSERQFAAAHTLAYLLAHGATGVVSTHDLALSEAPEVASSAILAHFTDSFIRGPEGLSMQFDYVLRPGLATATNALHLMEMAGLPLPETRPGAPGGTTEEVD